MKFSPLLLASVGLAQSFYSPTDSYAPGNVDCPSNGTDIVRKGEGLSPQERDWVQNRHEQTRPELLSYLKRVGFKSVDPDQFLGQDTNITIGLSFSGGGYRAMLAGAGQFAALDARTPNATEQGHVGGLVQAATYLVGLSGGNWMVGSVVINNFTTIPELQHSSDVWDLEHSMINPGGINIFKTGSYWDDIRDDVNDKQAAGYNTSFTDIWGRGLSYQFFNASNTARLTWSEIQNYDHFKNHSMPYPIVVADGRAPGTRIISGNSTIFEMSPFEVGSWDPNVYSFAKTEWLGTNMTNGKPNGTCVHGFDNAGFVVGTSSSLFNQFILQLNSTGVTGVVYDLAHSILKRLDKDSDDIAIYSPNPFKGMTYLNNNSISNTDYLDLVDGGEDGQNVPYYPLLQPERAVDVIISYDNSADTDFNWPNGTSAVQTYRRQFENQNNGTIFPYVPDVNTFINENLTSRPAFFGCDVANLTSLDKNGYTQVNSSAALPPLIVYIANYPWTFFSNTSTMSKLSYDKKEVAGMIENGYSTSTQFNGTVDPDWPVCLGCALLQREATRRNQSLGSDCDQCFQKYCWNGKTDDNAEKALKFAPQIYANGPNVSSNASIGQATSTSKPKKNGAEGLVPGMAGLVIGLGALLL